VFQPLNAISWLSWFIKFAFKWVKHLYRYNLAQYELGEMFRRGLFTDSVEMFLARKYLTLAAEQGHAEAVAQLEEMRRDGLRCALCGADDAPNACSYCPKTRYCDMECSIAHWRRGGGFASTLGAAEKPHKETCARTLARREKRARKKSKEEEEEEEERGGGGRWGRSR
jgi:TPR repeat protein